MPKEESYSIMKSWHDKCDKLERLNLNAKAMECIFVRGRYSKAARIAMQYDPGLSKSYDIA
jgi:hypothetical protein